MQVVFSILHYLTSEDTIECIESIQNNIQFPEYFIIVVDNHSNNGSYELLKNRYHSNQRIILLTSSDNVGFARGNNIGFKYAKNVLKADFIVMLNNDTIINQPDFVEKLINKYESEQYAVMGPDILSAKTGKHQNPTDDKILSLNDVENLIRRLKKKLFYYRHHLALIYETEKRIKRKFISQHSIKKNKKILHLKERSDVQLHGSCLIFSPIYINQFNGLYDATFMFVEEEILYYILQNEKLKSLYCPELQIIHTEDQSTNAKFHGHKQRIIFKSEQLIKSLEEYKKVRGDRKTYILNMTQTAR